MNQTEQRKNYHIITNANRRKILVIDDVLDVDRTPDLKFEDFDATYINLMSPLMDRNMLAIRLASPLYSEKCRFKPCYVTRRLEGWLGKAEVIIDGYASSPTSNAMARGIEEIYSNMRSLNFQLNTPPLVTHAEEILRLCRYAISRRQFTFSSEPTPGLSSGYMSLYYYTLWSEEQELMQMDERHFLHQQLLKLGYIKRTKYINKLHVCPHCRRSHLLFFESCPKCSSSNLKEEAVIHHFRCANVSPESSYAWDGELRCPKCKHMLRHIGVDYDKPSSVYTCQECNDSFMYPDMKVLCTNCRSSLRTDQLIPLDVEEFEFTPEGIRAFAGNDARLTISQTGFYGYSSIRDLLDYLRMFSKRTSETMDDEFVVARFKIYDPDAGKNSEHDVVPPVVRAMKRFFNYKSALSGNDYYFLFRVKDSDVAKKRTQMEFELNAELDDYRKLHPGFEHELVDTYIFSPGEDVEQFINRIQEERN